MHGGPPPRDVLALWRTRISGFNSPLVPHTNSHDTASAGSELLFLGYLLIRTLTTYLWLKSNHSLFAGESSPLDT